MKGEQMTDADLVRILRMNPQNVVDAYAADRIEALRIALEKIARAEGDGACYFRDVAEGALRISDDSRTKD
jgi:hypothetical protein